jgi:hypothetical protein
MPNTIAYVMLLLWPVVIAGLFFALKPKTAIIYSLLASYLLLPVRTSFDFAGIPPLDKTLIPNVTIFIFAILFARMKPFAIPNSIFIRISMIVFIVSPLFTTYNNLNPIIFPARIIPAMTWYDGITAAIGQIVILLPFIVGAQLLSDEESHKKLLIALVISGLFYSFPMLVEVRLSPQLHTLVYGFFPHDFSQQIRSSGFRPMVFLGHGLLVAIFCAMAFIASVCLVRTKTKILGLHPGIVAGYLLVLLYLCKSLGALLLALAFAPIVMLLRTRRIALISALFGLTMLFYPALRGGGLIPVNTISELAGSVNDERQGSLVFRLENEEKLLAKANDKPLFGWGTWGRNFIYDGWDNRPSSVTDGTWIIVVGKYGWIGYLACFGLLCYPLVARLRRNRLYKDLSFATVGLGAVHLVNLLDLLPNSSITPITWMIAGALAGNLTLRLTNKARKRPVSNTILDPEDSTIEVKQS